MVRTKKGTMRSKCSWEEMMFGFMPFLLSEENVGGWFCPLCIQVLIVIPRDLVAVRMLALS